MKALATTDQTHDCGQESIPLEFFPVLRHLGERDLAALRAVMVPKECDKGDCVLPLGEGTSTVVAVRRGSVRVSLISPDGRELVLHRRKAGAFVRLLDDDAPRPVPVVAQATVDETLLSLIPGDTFRAVTRTNPDATDELFSLVGETLRGEERALYDLFAFTINARLAHILVDLAEESPDGVVRTRQDELAAMVGTTRQEVTRILGCFRDQWWIVHTPHTHEVCVLDTQQSRSRGQDLAQ